jgi:hypothetical protein
VDRVCRFDYCSNGVCIDDSIATRGSDLSAYESVGSFRSSRRVASIAGRTSGRVPNRLIPTNGDRAILTLLSYRNTWESQSEQKSAQDYLYAIRHEHDPNASLKIVGSFETARYGQRNVYRCCCDYNSFVNEWLVVFITDGHNAVDIDAWTPLCGGTLQYQPTIQAIARSVTFKNI